MYNAIILPWNFLGDPDILRKWYYSCSVLNQIEQYGIMEMLIH